MAQKTLSIQAQLPQFPGPPALVVASGRQTAVIYLAHQGQIREIDRYQEETPVYSDREGSFKKSGQGRDLAQGSVYENKKDYIEDRYKQALSARLKKILHKYDNAVIYFFCPKYISASIMASLPQNGVKKIAFCIDGNYHQEHPFELLKMLQEEIRSIGQGRPPASQEAGKLLDTDRLKEV